MRLALSAALALSAVTSAACSAEAPPEAGSPTPSQAVAALVRFEPPKGWTVDEYANSGGADPVLAFVDGVDRITVRVFGAPGSVHRTPAEFLSGPAASTMGRRPETIGSVTVAGRTVTLHEHGFPVQLGDPHVPSPGPPELGREVFCVLPAAGGRFLVLAHARESPVPDPDREGEDAWEAFLKSVRPVERTP